MTRSRVSRRQFLEAASLLAGGGALPALWQKVALAAGEAGQPGTPETVLVVVELTGGNDGLNTVIPIRDPAYAAARPTLKPPAEKVHRIDGELSLHPALSGLSKLLENNQLAIVQGVGYPNPDRSHFVSMDIWHSALLAPDPAYGWLGRAVDRLGPEAAGMHVGGGSVPLALRGPAERAVSLRSLDDLQLQVASGGDGEGKRRLVESFSKGQLADDGNLLGKVRQTARESYASSERLREIGRTYDTPVAYPETGLAARLKLVAQLIAAGVPERVYYTALAGFDTHSDQAKQHEALLEELGGALAAFQADLVHHGQQGRVLTVTFSEFGRRVKENGSLGTDHGAASQMFVVGEAIQAGPVGAHPSLTDLVDGDLKFHTDFRSVYATVLEEWLRLPAEEILGAAFARVPLLGARSPA